MEKGEDKEEYIELQKLLDFPEDITEITPPKSAVNWKQLAQDYARSVVPHIITWLPKYNLQKLRGMRYMISSINVILRRLYSWINCWSNSYTTRNGLRSFSWFGNFQCVIV